MVGALSLCAEATGDRALAQRALELARGAATHRPEPEDATLCHGAAGLCLMFNRMFQRTGDPVLRDGAAYWAGRALAKLRPGEGVGGFAAWRPWEDREHPWAADPGLAVGAAGAALALLAAASDVEPEWDRALLLSVR